jgi:hypothetical protein
VYDFGRRRRVDYIAMEYVRGNTLSRYLASRVKFSEADVASLAAQLLDALGHAHENGVWHRDVKPSNVIMTKSGRIKIADFGIARTDNTGLTMANSVLGTPMYMAPEQFMGRHIDHRVDLYGAGVVLYQLIAGRPPFVGTPESLMYRVVNDMPLPPSAAEGAMHGDRFDRALLTALAKDPSERYASAAAFRNAVAAALGQPVPPAVSQDAVYALPMPTEYAPTERIAPLHATGSAPTHWDPAVLAQVESSLARHVGPLAGVLVRRASRTCADLPALQAALAEQITNAAAREAFLGARSGSAGTSGGATGGTAGSRGTGSSGSSTPFQGSGARAPAPAPATFGSMTMGAPVSDALLEQAQRLLAQHLGPIARVVVKRAAERTRQRTALFTLLADAVPEAARSKLLADLARLS